MAEVAEVAEVAKVAEVAEVEVTVVDFLCHSHEVPQWCGLLVKAVTIEIVNPRLADLISEHAIVDQGMSLLTATVLSEHAPATVFEARYPTDCI